MAKKRGRKPGFKMDEETKQKLRLAHIDPKVTDRREKIFDYLVDNEHDLKKRIRRGIVQEIASALNMGTAMVKDDIKIIRRQCGITRNPKGSSEVITPTCTGVHDSLIKHNLFRASLLETPVCDKIVNILYGNVLPSGGVGLLIGTATPLCVLKKDMYSKIIDDNLEVARALLKTTSRPLRIVVGNAKSRVKANEKAYLWKSFMNCRTIIKTDKVDKVSFEYHIKNLVKKYHLVKVILLTSGVWKHRQPSQKTHGDLDLRFEVAAIKLTRRYSNLHILAMCKNNSYGFDLRYLHRNRNEVIYRR